MPFQRMRRPRYLLHDRDSVFADVATTIAGMNIQAVRTAPRSPWQNAYVERVIGSIRRECLDHVIVANAAGLHRVLTRVRRVLHAPRTHLALDKDAPISRPVMPPWMGGSSRRRTSAGSTTATIARPRSHRSTSSHDIPGSLAVDIEAQLRSLIASCRERPHSSW